MACCPTVCTLDASVALNLHAAQILDRALRLPCAYQVTDLMLAEHEDDACRDILGLSVAVVHLTPGEMQELDRLARADRKLSICDHAAFILSRRTHAVLLTDDGRLRAKACLAGLTVHGTLWILDELVTRDALVATEAADALEAMLDHGARLPNVDCEKRLMSWRDAAPP